MLFDFKSYHDKAVAIYGAGPVGLSVFSALYKAGAHIFLWDPSEKIRARLKDAHIRCIDPREWPWEELVLLVPDSTSQARLSLSHKVIRKAAASGVPVQSDVDMFAACVERLPENERPTIVGVSGTHGKSVTGTMIAHILKEAGRDVIYADSENRPVLSLEEGKAGSAYVLELSTKTLAFTRHLRCDAGVLLNLTGADVKFFGSPEKAIKSASRVFRNQELDDALIIGADDSICQKICTALSSSTMSESYGSENIIPVSGEATLGQGIFSLDGHVYDARFGKSVEVGSLNQPLASAGPHINMDVAAVYAACQHIGISGSQVIKSLQGWSGLEGCMQYLGEMQNVIHVNDASSRSVRSTLSALKCAQNIFWVGGGRKTSANFSLLREAGENVTRAYLYGEAAEEISAAINPAIGSETFASVEEALARALGEAGESASTPGAAPATVLLSPACRGKSPSVLSGILNAMLQKRLKETAA